MEEGLLVGRGDKVNRSLAMPLYSPAVEKPQQPGSLSPHTKERAFVLGHYLIRPSCGGPGEEIPVLDCVLGGSK